MKKISFLINSLTSGGAERVLSTLLNELQHQGYNEIELICIEKNNFYELDKNIKVSYLSNNNGNLHPILKLLSLPFLALKLKKHIQKNNIQIIQSHVYRANYVNALSKIFGAKHKVQMVNAGQVSMYKEKGFIGKVNLFLIKNLYPLAEKVICKSKGMEYDLQEYFTNKLNTTIINNPYDIDKIIKQSNEEIDDFTFDKKKKYLIYIGRFASFKRPDYVIKALKELDEHIQLILLGDGPDKSKLESLVKELQLSTRVHFLGRVSNPYKYVKKSDIFILSSKDGEGFPNVLAEAMICETSVISTDCKSGPREILADDTDVSIQLKNKIEVTNKGILVPMENSSLLAKAINYLFENENIKKELINNASKKSLEFSLKSIINKYKKVLEIE